MTSGIMRDFNETFGWRFMNETAPLAMGLADPFFYDILESFHLIFDLGVHVAVTVLIHIMRI